MTRPIKRQIHIYFPEATHRGNKVDLCENFYIKHSFQRKIKQAIIKPYANEFKNEFNRAMKDKNKRNSLNPDDLFFIVLDTDIHASGTNVTDVISHIQSLNQKYGHEAKIILSGRSFEVWLCMYGRQLYTKPYTSQSELNSDVIESYEKKEQWYIDNATRLYNQYTDAKAASILSKQHVLFGPPPSECDLVYGLPSFSNQSVTTYLVEKTPFTYFEHLIAIIKQYE